MVGLGSWLAGGVLVRACNGVLQSAMLGFGFLLRGLPFVEECLYGYSYLYFSWGMW